jgi:hypothetical protein
MTRMRESKNTCLLLVERHEGNTSLQDIGVNQKMILKRFL